MGSMQVEGYPRTMKLNAILWRVLLAEELAGACLYQDVLYVFVLWQRETMGSWRLGVDAVEIRCCHGRQCVYRCSWHRE
jgi:hypothetical protein